MNKKHSLKEAVRVLATGEHSRDHPSPDTLLAYHQRDLPDENFKEIRSHLVWCSECALVVLDLARFPDIDGPGERSVEEVVEDRRILEERLLAEPEAQGLPPTNKGSVRHLPSRSIYTLAALFLLATTGFLAWIHHLQQEVMSLSGPEPNIFVVDLWPEEHAKTRDASTLVMTVPADVQSLALLLNTDDVTGFDSYVVEVLDTSQSLIWGSDTLARGPEGSFSIRLPLDILPKGRADIRIYGRDSTNRFLLGAYSIHVESANRNFEP